LVSHRDKGLLQVGTRHLEVLDLDATPEEFAQDLLRLVGEKPYAMVLDLFRVQGQTRELAFIRPGAG